MTVYLTCPECVIKKISSEVHYVGLGMARIRSLDSP
jgi:hypothetical protein